MLELDNDFELLDSLINTDTIICTNICKLCYKPFETVCEECGFCYDVHEYTINGLYNYTKIQKVCYQKVTHFKEVLCNFQGRECKIIPDEVLSLIKSHVNNDIQLIDLHVIKHVLKKNKLTKYVENVNSILFILTNSFNLAILIVGLTLTSKQQHLLLKTLISNLFSFELLLAFSSSLVFL